MSRLAIVLLAVSARAYAAPADEQRRESDGLFQAARALVEQGHFDEACPKFAKSHQLDPAPGTLLNLANCEEQLGQFADAHAHYTEALSILPDADERKEKARARAAALLVKIPRLVLVPPPNAPPGFSVLRNEQALSTQDFKTALLVNPGTQRLVVKAPSRQDRAVELTLASGEQRIVTLELGPPVSTASEGGSPPLSNATHAERAARTTWPTTTGWVLLAGAGAGVVVGSVTGAMAMSAAQTAKDECPQDSPDAPCTLAGQEAHQSGATTATISTVAFISAGVLGAGALGLLLWGGDNDDEGSARAHFSPLGASVSGSF